MSAALPRVTEILRAVGLSPDLSGIRPDVLEAGRLRGTAVHEALEAECYGYLDEASLTEDVLTRVTGARRFCKESGYKQAAAEVPVQHAAWRYRGHLDSVGWLGAKRMIVDWKTGESVALPSAGYQLAAYRLAWNSEHPTEPVEMLGVVLLLADGSYRFHEVSPTAAEPIWLAAVVVYHAQGHPAKETSR